MKYFSSIAITVLFLASCNKDNHQKITIKNDILSECNQAIQNAIVVDHISAPVASRRYFYSCVAAYESLVPFFSDRKSLVGQLHQFKSIPTVDTGLGYCLDLVALSAHTYTAAALVYKKDSINSFRERSFNYYKNLLTSNQFKNSVAWGDSVGAAVVKWSKSDSFGFYRGRDFYLAKEDPGFWQSTPTEYKQAIEPMWGHIRTAVVPIATKEERNAGPIKYYKRGEKYTDTNCFATVALPEPYSKSTSSRFYKLSKDVYDAVNRKDSLEQQTAKYWDDNPNSTVHYGHATVNVLKVSPAGHWLGIFSTVSRQKKYSLIENAEGMALLSTAVFDAFITCWKVKYETEYIRPVNAIRTLIDSSWLPSIETPAFPEYPSGHSVVSSASATTLTYLFGDFPFTDSTEMEFGLGTRKFSNFRQAANEACKSRLYGGIHFIDAIEDGKLLGNRVGNWVVSHVKTRK